MKRKLMSVMAIALAVLMMASAFAIMIPFVTAAEEKTFNTTTPIFLYDFSTEDIQTTFANTAHMTTSMGDGYTTFTATENDPYTWIKTPSCKPSEAKYAVIRYRTTASYKGEFFCSRSDNNAMGTAGTNQQWMWNPSGNWETIVIANEAWMNAKDSVTFDIFRIDPLEGGVQAGASIDIQYVAFFSSEADANGFNFDEYTAKLAWEEEQKKAQEEADKTVNWPDPTYKEMETSEKDTAAGTLKYIPSEDGSTVTISYEVNGETISYTVPNNHNYLMGGYAGTDDLNRPLHTSDEVGAYGSTGEKYVGLFYFLWHGEHGDSGIFDLQKIIDTVGVEAAGSTKCGKYGPVGAMHWFAEPLYGYYYANDAWVHRKHAELLTLANIDFLYFDVTNGYAYMHNAKQLMAILHELNEKGFDAPQVVFYTNTNPENVIREVYNNIYKKGLYKDVWFMLDGKPMIMGWPGSLNSKDAAIANEIKSFFTFRSNLGGYLDKETAPNQWGWLSRFPQAYFHNDKDEVEQITVGTAVNHNYVKRIIAPMSYGENIIGRTWTSRGYDTRENAVLYGACFAEQWENALAVDPEIVFVTAWNEWVAMRIDNWPASPEQYQNCFVDQYNTEFSRDCEPSAGILKDHYYYQLVDNIRKFKGTNPIEKASQEKLIAVDGGFGQWADVTPVYNDYFGLPDRDALGYKDPETGKRFHYTNDSGRNDIYDAKVARDYENIYFMVRTVEDLTPYTDPYWMRLYVDMGESEQNWENYEFILNKQNPKNETTATLERFTGKGFETEVVGEVTYSVKGNVLTVCIPKTMLGIAADQLHFEFGFKWTDNTLEDGDIMQWYLNGDVAPVGRFNYCYTTDGSAAYNEAEADLGNSYIDFTNPEQVEEFKTWLLGSTEGVKYEFTADGLVLNCEEANAAFMIDFTKASPQVALDRYDSFEVTYKVTDGKTDKLRLALGSTTTPFQSVRTKSLTLTPDGEVHTVSTDLRSLRVVKGYATELAIFFEKNTTGGSVIIQSIQFVEAEDAE